METLPGAMADSTESVDTRLETEPWSVRCKGRSESVTCAQQKHTITKRRPFYVKAQGVYCCVAAKSGRDGERLSGEWVVIGTRPQSEWRRRKMMRRRDGWLCGRRTGGAEN